jgi:proteic killer suppression protein
VVIIILDPIKKDLRKIPKHIQIKLFNWANAVEKFGIEYIRKVSGYHDEPLKGKRVGQRSIRLSKSYRAIYVEQKDKSVNIITIIKVSKHEY